MTKTQKRIDGIITHTLNDIDNLTDGFGIALSTESKEEHIRALESARRVNRYGREDYFLAPVLVTRLSSIAVEGLLDIYPDTTYQRVLASGKTWMLFADKDELEDMLKETDVNSGWTDSRLSMAFDNVNRDLSPKQQQWIESRVMKSIAKTRRTLQQAIA